MPRRSPSAVPREALVALMRATRSSWSRARSGNRQSIADIGQKIFEIAIFLALRFEGHGPHLAVAGDKTPADRAHAAPLGTIDWHRIKDSEGGRQDFGAQPLPGVLNMAGSAGKIQLSAPRVEIALAVLVSCQRAGIIGNADVEWLTAGGKGHIGGQRRHLIPGIGERCLAIGFAALVQRELKRNDFAALFIELRIGLPDADSA